MNQGSRRGRIPQVRSGIAERLAKELRMPLTEVAKLSAVSTSAISKILNRITQESNESFNLVNNVPSPCPSPPGMPTLTERCNLS